MPISTSSRSSAAYTASIMNATPSRPKFPRAMSPSSTSSYCPTITAAGQLVKMNIVTRIAIEGKAKQGQDGVSIRMYMKLSIPVDSVTPGSTVALFPEENIKILTSQIHPLDSNSVPYNFSSTVSPLLHNAARVLNLPARSTVSFNPASQLGSTLNTASSSTASTSRLRESDAAPTVPPVDPQYTGQILVSGYHIAYVLPKHFSSHESEAEHSSYSNRHRRRPSVTERNHAHFMAAVDMWVPYLMQPPRFPYLLSIPTPRCLHNNIKLRIFSPSNTTSSFASLSSLEDDANTWDLTSDPHVTRTTSTRLSRSSSHNHLADDESSDSSTAGFSDGFGIQGTFPSTDCIRVRWAKPMKSFDIAGTAGDIRRRVGVKDVKSDMVCSIRGRQKINDEGPEGIIMDVEYKASCKGIWFPGVATLLGMDVGLVAKNSEVSWVEGSLSEWDVVGGVGYTGFNVTGTGRPNLSLSSRTSSMELSPQIVISSSAENHKPLQSDGRNRCNSSSSTSSLLRAPLPSQHVPEYSFESSNDPTASTSSNLGTLSSVSLSQSSATVSPQAPLTLHLNMNEFLPPAKSPFTFTITGTILVTPRPSLPRANGFHDARFSTFTDHDETTEPITLPKFTVLAADAETTNIIVRNEVDRFAATVEVYNPSGDIHRDPQARKTVLQKGGCTRCGEDGGRIALKLISSPHEAKSPGRPQTLNDASKLRIPYNTSRSLNTNHQIRDGPPLIPSVMATVTPLLSCHRPLPDAYAVRVHLNAPVNSETDWLEFGLARLGPSSSRTLLPEGGETHSPNVHIAGASVDGVPVRCETTNSGQHRVNGEARHSTSYEIINGKEWTNWVKIYIGPSSGEKVVIDYVVKTQVVNSSWFSSWNSQKCLAILLPTFTLPVGRFEVRLEDLAGFTCLPINSSLAHQHRRRGGCSLFHFSQEEFFTPQLTLGLRSAKSASFPLWLWVITVLLCCSVFVFAVLFQRLTQEVLQVQSYLKGNEPYLNTTPIEYLDPVTVTATFISTVTADLPHNSWWFMHQPPPLTQQEASTSAISHISTSPSISPQPPMTDTTIPASATPTSSQDLLAESVFHSFWEKLSLAPIQDFLGFVSLPGFGSAAGLRRLVKYIASLEKAWQILW